MMGGGSAQLPPHHKTSLLDVLTARLGDRLAFEPGCRIDKSTPEIAGPAVATPDGDPGVRIELWKGHAREGEPAATMVRPDTRLPVRRARRPASAPTSRCGPPPSSRPSAAGPTSSRSWSSGTPGCSSTARSSSRRPRASLVGHEAFGMASIEREVPDRPHGRDAGGAGGRVHVPRRAVRLPGQGRAQAGTDRSRDPTTPRPSPRTPMWPSSLVGTSDEWESEGHDRASMDLPGDQDELVRRVAAANPRTVVLVNAGAPVTMPWADDVAAVVQVWLGGQEMASAVDDVLFGDAEPAGRLPTTIPLRLEHNPTYGTFPGRERPSPLRRGPVRRLPLVRHAAPAGALPVRPRWQLHDLRVGGGDAVGRRLPAGGTVAVTVPVTNTRRPARGRGRAVLRAPAAGPSRPAGP